MNSTIDLIKKIYIILSLKFLIFPKICDCRNLHKLFYLKMSGFDVF